MELRDYLKIIGKRIWILIVAVIIITLVSFLVTRTKPETYEGGFSVNVLVTDNNGISDSQNQDYFKYNNYYAWQSGSSFADALASWMADPANVAEIYEKSNFNIPVNELKQYFKLFTVKKTPPSSVFISISSTDKTQVENLLFQASNFIKTKAQDWTNKGLISNVTVDIGEPLVISKKPGIALNSLIGLAAGIIVGLALIFFVDYMKRTRN